MTKLEYIKESHKRANHKLWLALERIYLWLRKRSIFLAYLWKPIAWIYYGFVYVFSWLSFAATLLFSDIRYSIYFMEFEIAQQEFDNIQARNYLQEKQGAYERQLAYGNYSKNQQSKINYAFKCLFSRYPAVKQKIIDPQLTSIETITQQTLIKIDTVVEKVEPVSEYAKIKLDKELRESAAEAKLQKEREKRVEQISNIIPDFESKLTDKQIAILTKCINEVQLFSKPLSEKDVANIFTCKLRKPLQIARGKTRQLVYLFVQLFIWNYICIEWQSVCEKNKLFLSSQDSKILTSGNISSVTNQVNDLPPRNHEIINNYIDQLKQA